MAWKMINILIWCPCAVQSIEVFQNSKTLSAYRVIYSKFPFSSHPLFSWDGLGFQSQVKIGINKPKTDGIKQTKGKAWLQTAHHKKISCTTDAGVLRTAVWNSEL